MFSKIKMMLRMLTKCMPKSMVLKTKGSCRLISVLRELIRVIKRRTVNDTILFYAIIILNI